MRIALLMNPWQLTFRGKWTWDDIYNDPRGMSGSELGFVEIANGLVALGYDVVMFTDSEIHTFQHHWDNSTIAGLSKQLSSYPGHYVLPWHFIEDKTKGKFDLAIAINHPGGLEHFDCPKLTIQWLNSFEFLSQEQVQSVDHWVSPSDVHRDYILGMTHDLSDGAVRFASEQWSMVPLGCDPAAYSSFAKVPGRVVYTSSPDRGLHHLLHVWPRIKRAVPHAELEIYYRLRPWIDELKSVPEPFIPIEENRQRALYVDAALRRLEGDKWGVRVMGAVSRNRIARAIGEAECFAYPTETLRFSEGFSCSTLEACAAGACPVIWDCDALGGIYSGAAEVLPRGDEEQFASTIIRALTDEAFRTEVNDRCKKFARNLTWRESTKRLLEISQGLSKRSTAGSGASVAAGNGSPQETDSATA